METESLNKLIRSRRATPPRFFNSNKISEGQIRTILENAVWVPNHKKTEPWRFIVFQGPNKQKFIEEGIDKLEGQLLDGEVITRTTTAKFRQNTEKSSVAIAVIAEFSPEGLLPEWEEIAAVSMAVQNMWLTAASLGISAFWSTPQFAHLLNEFLELTPRQKNMGLFFLGYSEMEFPSPGRSPIDEKVRWGI